MDFAAFKGLIEDLARLNGLSEHEACEVSVKIGDTPQLDAKGRAIVDGRTYILTEKRI